MTTYIDEAVFDEKWKRMLEQVGQVTAGAVADMLDISDEDVMKLFKDALARRPPRKGAH